MSELQDDFEKYAGDDHLLEAHELSRIWKASAEKKVGKLSVKDERIIDESVKAFFSEMDADKTGKVTYAEFVAFALGRAEEVGPLKEMRSKLNSVLKENPKKIQDIIEQFRNIDKNGDGFVTPEELEEHLAQLAVLAAGGDPTARRDHERLKKISSDIFSEADVDRDGRVDLWEVMAHALGRRRQPVEVLLYDISHGFAEKLGPVLMGKKIQAVHSGVLVFGSEYWYGGRIFRSPPPCVEVFGQPLSKPWGEQLSPSEYRPDLPVVRVGYTFVTHEEFAKWLRTDVCERYTGLHQYDLLTHSCNHFSNEVITFLTGSGIPDRILELQKSFITPRVRSLRPFLNKYLGGFGEHHMGVDENLFSIDITPSSSQKDVCSEVLGQGAVVLIDGMKGADGEEVVATILKEEDGMLEVKYFDPLKCELATKSNVPSASVHRISSPMPM